jgi:monofunctional chorismate mutase
MDNKLEKYRSQINDIDKKILDLIENRTSLSLKIGAYKKENNIPILNSNREKEVLDLLNKYNNDNSLNLEEEFINELWINIMSYSKKIQV